MSQFIIFATMDLSTIIAIVSVLAVIILFIALRQGRTKTQSSPRSSETSEDVPNLKQGLRRTREEGFVGRISSLFKGRALNEELLDEVEEVLLTSDIGVKTSDKLLQGLKSAYKSGEVADIGDVWNFLRSEATDILTRAGSGKGPDPAMASTPQVIIMVGVNGTGKTTTTGKLASLWKNSGKNVILGAGDTFRAAAVEQLQAWGSRVGVPVVAGKADSDPASVLFQEEFQ